MKHKRGSEIVTKIFDPKKLADRTPKKLERDVTPVSRVPKDRNTAKVSGAAKRLKDKQI